MTTIAAAMASAVAAVRACMSSFVLNVVIPGKGYTVAEGIAYDADPRRIILSGHSAGAHLAALLLFGKRYFSTFEFHRNRILGFIGLAESYTFNPLAYESTRAVFSTVQDADQARPIAFVDGSEPPLLLMHGGSDDTVEMVNAQKLTARVRKAGGEARFIGYAQRSHIGLILSVATPFRGRDPVYADMLSFMEWLSMPSAPTAVEAR